MAKIIAAFNMTLDGNCDHRAGVADAQLHDHYTELLRNAGSILYGRTTYHLMEFWPPLVRNPSGERSMDEFALVIDKIPKVVFSRTLKELSWPTARLAKHDLETEVKSLKEQAGKDVLVGSRSLIVQLLNLGLIDELQLCIQPVLAGKGLYLFDDIDSRKDLALEKTDILKPSGSIILYYKTVR